MTGIGELGERLVSQWLAARGWTILHHRWQCRWGEIDLIARLPSAQGGTDTLAFIEVKTRRGGNWDEGGLLAITPRKQAKLRRTARLFLAQFPHLADLACRFDVALVSYAIGGAAAGDRSPGEESALAIGQPVACQGYQLLLQDYLESAFEGEGPLLRF